MSLLSLWTSDRQQITGKRLDQLIAFSGDGLLRDGGGTQAELRELLRAVPTDLLEKWKHEALERRYENFGFVLQDMVNEVGHRLGFSTIPGGYRGRSGATTPDGIWKTEDGHVLLVETKTSSNYRIELAHIVSGREQVANELNVDVDQVSVLIVIAEDNTEELEAQVRGSRHAWDVRLIGIDALLKMLHVRESVEDESVERQIQNILLPQEFTRLDAIVELVFATTEEAQENEPSSDTVQKTLSTSDQSSENLETPSRNPRVDFYGGILPRLESHFGTSLVKRGRVFWTNPEETLSLSCQVSRTYPEQNGSEGFWFGIKPAVVARLKASPKSYCTFGLGSPDAVLVIDFDEIHRVLPKFNTTSNDDGSIFHWHIQFKKLAGHFLLLIPHAEPIDFTRFLI